MIKMLNHAYYRFKIEGDLVRDNSIIPFEVITGGYASNIGKILPCPTDNGIRECQIVDINIIAVKVAEVTVRIIPYSGMNKAIDEKFIDMPDKTKDDESAVLTKYGITPTKSVFIKRPYFKVYRLDKNKIKTLDDVINVIAGVGFRITIQNDDDDADVYENLKDYLILEEEGGLW